MAWNIRPLTKKNWNNETTREKIEAYNEEFLPDLCMYQYLLNFRLFEFLGEKMKLNFSVTKIAEFEERDLENATEYLKYRLDDKKNHFDVNFYNQEKGSN